MRLIEVADLEKFIQENVCAIGDDHLLLVAGDDGRWHEALPLVKTAYSVDKVVEELEKRKQEYLDGFVLHENNELYGVACGLGDAVKIVKQGGVSDDVCEWKVFDNSLTDEPQWVYGTTCGKYVGEEHTSKAFAYCPYCGKKIKVVE